MTISRSQLNQKIMRVCISYTHPYPIKSLNHTSPFRKYKLYFGANMQVASTLWSDIKSQKISERRFRLKWTKCSPRTSPNKVKTGQPQCGSDKEAQDSLPEEVGGSWWLGQADRPTGRPTWSVGPTTSTSACGASRLVPYVGCEGSHPWLPAINTRGGRE